MAAALEEEVKTLRNLQEGIFNRVFREHLFLVNHHAKKPPLTSSLTLAQKLTPLEIKARRLLSLSYATSLVHPESRCHESQGFPPGMPD